MAKNKKYTKEFKHDAISQVTNRGYSIPEVSKRLGMSSKTLYRWVKEQQKPVVQTKQETELSSENRLLKAELRRVTEERDILKKAAAYFAKETL